MKSRTGCRKSRYRMEMPFAWTDFRLREFRLAEKRLSGSAVLHRNLDCFAPGTTQAYHLDATIRGMNVKAAAAQSSIPGPKQAKPPQAARQNTKGSQWPRTGPKQQHGPGGTPEAFNVKRFYKPTFSRDPWQELERTAATPAPSQPVQRTPTSAGTPGTCCTIPCWRWQSITAPSWAPS